MNRIGQCDSEKRVVGYKCEKFSAFLRRNEMSVCEIVRIPFRVDVIRNKECAQLVYNF